jgi:integrase
MMLPAPVNNNATDPPAALLASYAAHLALTGRGNTAYTTAARTFVVRWPHVQDWALRPLHLQLAANNATKPFVTFLMVSGRLRPDYDYLLARKFSSLWREVIGTGLEADLARFKTAAGGLGFSDRVASALASQVIARLLIHTGRTLDTLTDADVDELVAACGERQDRTGRSARSYRGLLQSTRQVLFHQGVLPAPAARPAPRLPFDKRMAAVPSPLHEVLVRYLQRKSVTCVPATVSGIATRLAHFGRVISELDPTLTGPDGLERCRHIEPYLIALSLAENTKSGGTLSIAEQSRRVNAVANFLTEITEWGWPDAPTRRLLFRSDIPRLPRPLPRYLPPDADRILSAELVRSPNRLTADALLLQRAAGLRIGELLDLEMDCVHEVPGQGSWLKVPLGKLATERMVPLDDDALEVLDRISITRSPGRPIPHPRTGRPADFLFTHHGHRMGQNALRTELARAGQAAGLGHITTHQLRHTYATALINAGVSLQALMALLGHVSAEMSLRYGRLFDSTVRTEYERALDMAKARIGPLPTGRRTLPLVDITNGDWRETPMIKARMAGGYCLRAPAQEACPYANICEHCPSYRTDNTHLPVLTSQRHDAEILARDAAARGWSSEAQRHQKLVEQLDILISEAHTG